MCAVCPSWLSFILYNPVRKGGILSIYEPTIEVSKSGMQKTIELFEQKGFSREFEHDRAFTRFARLRKNDSLPKKFR